MRLSIVVGGEERPVPGLHSVESGSVFHYTSAHGLEGIIRTHSLWASSALQMNDESEVSYAAKIVRRVIEKRPGPAARTVKSLLTDDWVNNLRAKTYIASASLRPDLLTQWLHYAGALGYCIELSAIPHVIPNTGGGRPFTEWSFDGDDIPTFGWYPVLYTKREQRDAITAILDFFDEHQLAQDPSSELARAHVRTVFAMLLPQLKHPAFKDEREVRHICFRQTWTTELHRAGPFGLVPYIELRRVVTATSDVPLQLPIANVLVGPTPKSEQQAAIDAVRRLLTSHGYPPVKVTASKIPYRYPRSR